MILRRTGVISGYVVSRQALQTRLARSEVDARALQRERDEAKGGKWDVSIQLHSYGVYTC